MEVERKVDETYELLYRLEDEIYEIKRKIEENDYVSSEDKDLREYFDKLKELEKERFKLEDRIIYLRRTVVATDSEIELVKSHRKNFFYIYKCGQEGLVGKIEYREDGDSFFGDIGYTIYSEYQGHNYAYKAFKLLNNILSEEGIETVLVTADKNNIASIKTIEKLGGVKVDSLYDYIVSYQVSTSYELKK